MSFENLPQPNYPAHYDNEDVNNTPSTTYLPYPTDQQSIIDYIVKMRNSIIALETSLGIKPFGTQSTVSKRLDLLETTQSQITGLGKSVHRIQIADKYSINSIYSNQISVGQIGLNLFEECAMSNANSGIEVFFKTHVYVEKNVILTLGLYKITDGVSTLITSFTFNNITPYNGGYFTKDIQLNLVSQLPITNTILELRALQTQAVLSSDIENKSIIWDASLIVQIFNNNDGSISNSNGRYVNTTSDDLIVWKFDDANSSSFYKYHNSGILGVAGDLSLPIIDSNPFGIAHCPEFTGIFNNAAMLSGNTMYTQDICAQPDIITISLWINLLAPITPNSCIALQKLDADSNVVFTIKTNADNAICFEYLGVDGITYTYSTPILFNSTNSWVFIGFVFDGTNVYTSINGNYSLMNPKGSGINYYGPLSSGNGKWAIINSNVLVDDLRIAQVARNKDWFQSIYKLGINQYA